MKIRKLQKYITICIIVCIFATLLAGSYAFFADRVNRNVEFQIATFSKDGYQIVRSAPVIPYAAGETVPITITETNSKAEDINSSIKMTAVWDSPDANSKLWGNASSEDNLVIMFGKETVAYSIESDRSISFLVPKHIIKASNTVTSELKFIIPNSLTATGNIETSFEEITISQAPTGFTQTFDHNELNADEELDFTTSIVWDMSKNSDMSVYGYLDPTFEGNSGEYGLIVTGSGAMRSWADSTSSSHSVYKDDVVELTIDSGVTTIGDNAFKGFRNVTSVAIPNSVTIIGTSAFESTGIIGELTIPASVTEIKDRAFAELPNVNEITFDHTSGNITLPSNGSVFLVSIYNSANPLRTKVNTSIKDVLDYNWAKDNRGYTVTVKSVTGAGVTADPLIAINGKTISLTVDEEDGYKYNGSNVNWVENSTNKSLTLTKDERFFVMPASDILITPNIELITYSITYHLNNGTQGFGAPLNYYVTSETFSLLTPTRIGYTFVGWTGSNGTTPQTTVSILKGSIGDKTYTANWIDITPPDLTVNNLPSYTNNSSTTVSGTVEDQGSGVDSVILIIGDAEYKATIQSNGFWTANVDLIMGNNDISVIAKDKAGNISSETVSTLRANVYNDGNGGFSGEVPPSEEPDPPVEIPEENLPKVIEFTNGTFDVIENFKPGEYKTVEYESTYLRPKYPVAYRNILWSKWLVTEDASGNVISTEADDIALSDIDKKYSTYIVYDFETDQALTMNDVDGDSVELWCISEDADDTLENAVYMAAYLNRADDRTSRHIAMWNGSEYIAIDADADIAAINTFTESYTVINTKQVLVTAPSTSKEYVYIPSGTMKAGAGMTWAQWLVSDYNTTGRTDMIIRDSNYNEISVDSTIVDGKSYGFTEPSTPPGLYKTGSNYTELLTSWDDLIAAGNITVTNGELTSDRKLAGDLMLPDDSTITAIGSNAFYGAPLTGITIPSSVVSIGLTAFLDSSLTSIIIPDSVTALGMQAFANCESLESVTIGKGVGTIGQMCFMSCPNLKSVTLSENLSIIQMAAFGACTSLTDIIIPNTVTTINSQAFANCTSLKSVTIGSGVSSIGAKAFQNTGLTSAIFLTTSGWTAGKTSVNVTNASNAATYLKTTYVSSSWKCSAATTASVLTINELPYLSENATGDDDFVPAKEVNEDSTFIGITQSIYSMPDMAVMNVLAAESAPQNYILDGWLVGSDFGQETVSLEDIEDTLNVVYTDAPDYSLTLTPLYRPMTDAEKLLAFAEEELGEEESKDDYVLCCGEEKGFTKYGDHYDLPYGDWCATFIGYGMDQIGLDGMPFNPSCPKWIDQAVEEELYYLSSEYIPAPGDIVFMDFNEDDSSDHVGIIKEFDLENGTYQAYEGNHNNAVELVTRTFDSRTTGYMPISEFGEFAEVEVPDASTDSNDLTATPSAPAAQQEAPSQEVPADTEPVTETEAPAEPVVEPQEPVSGHTEEPSEPVVVPVEPVTPAPSEPSEEEQPTEQVIESLEPSTEVPEGKENFPSTSSDVPAAASFEEQDPSELIPAAEPEAIVSATPSEVIAEIPEPAVTKPQVESEVPSESETPDPAETSEAAETE